MTARLCLFFPGEQTVCLANLTFLSYSQLPELTAPEGYILIHESRRIVFKDLQIVGGVREQREKVPDFYGRRKCRGDFGKMGSKINRCEVK